MGPFGGCHKVQALPNVFDISPSPTRSKNQPLSKGITEYLFRTPDLLEEAITAALHDRDMRGDDCEFYTSTRGWVECVELGNFDAYAKRFNDTADFFKDRTVDGAKTSAKMIETIAAKVAEQGPTSPTLKDPEDAAPPPKKNKVAEAEGQKISY
ncbi:hypothetical protein BDK51DRAFT_32472 [Blyttiomyces helicus]|uniref:Uncharacterized protein n=1 Tax=Blyttiomyces helicus TaxID=388810 RepID=A0A4P9WHY4_9FUNG|nr:hypothetical protein BDK51DRAFT_32472 [Blyttiomyces helicus]|eukprot:RKO92459.1 hypothetical protein BDK51DRAFT_32472 [Blyttiomyces helicus]